MLRKIKIKEDCLIDVSEEERQLEMMCPFTRHHCSIRCAWFGFEDLLESPDVSSPNHYVKCKELRIGITYENEK